jgi:hypothetical protein
MKRGCHPPLWGLLILLLGGIALLQMGCPGKNSPSNPNGGGGSTNTPTLTPTVTSTPVLAIKGGEFYRAYNIYGDGVTHYDAWVFLQLGGQPVTTAGVTLSSTGASVTLALPYSGLTTVGGQVYAGYLSTSAYTYTPGQTYVFAAAASGQTSSVSITAPGGNFTFSQDADGAVTEAQWGLAGNLNYVLVSCSNPATQTYQASSTSGTSFNIPDNGAGNVYSQPGSIYNVTVQVYNTNTSLPLTLVAEDYYELYPVTVLDNVWNSPIVSYSHDPNLGDGYLYQVGLNVQGMAPTTAAVTLSEGSNNLVLPYSNTYASGGVTYANYVYSYSGSSPGLAYSPGLNYILSTTGAAGTASATLTAPGPVFAHQDTTTTQAVTQLAWSYAGSYSNAVSMNETSPSSVPDYISNATSPVNFPLGTFYSGATSGTVYQAWTQLISSTTTIANGVLSGGSPFEIGETYTQTVTFN